MFSCKTLENPWLMNSPFQSCIPADAYELVRGNFKGKYENYELVNVPYRDHIEFHIGNRTEDTNGCILLGERYRIDEQYGKYWITNSRMTFGKFMAAMQGDQKALLVIRENLISTAGWN